MNQLNIIGNLTADPESRTNTAGKRICAFSVAVNRRGEGVDYFRVSAWEGLADNCLRYLKKGNKILVTGRVSVSAYKDREGNARASLEVIAEKVEFLTPKEKQKEQDEAEAALEDLGSLPF